VTFESIKTKKAFSGITKEGGKFDILVPKGDKYKVKYKTFTSDADYTVLDVPVGKGELLSFEVTIQFELPKQYTLDNVLFDSGKATLRPESSKELNELVEYMNLKKTLVIEIAGHTDNVGNADANLKLSQDRANTVRDYLIKKGIAENRVLAKGYGDTQPLGSNDTEKGKQKNRRTEVRVVKE
jgi:outer membrane protein OmpA-like peptidoglycan-associated protein